MKKFSMVALCVSLMLPLAALADTIPLVDPAPIIVPPNTAQDTVARAVLEGLAERKWKTVPGEQPGVVHATIIAHGGDQASVDVIYDTQQIQIKYVSSRKMDEAEVDGKRVIANRYINWSRNLAQSISKALGIVPAKN